MSPALVSRRTDILGLLLSHQVYGIEARCYAVFIGERGAEVGARRLAVGSTWVSKRMRRQFEDAVSRFNTTRKFRDVGRWDVVGVGLICTLARVG